MFRRSAASVLVLLLFLTFVGGTPAAAAVVAQAGDASIVTDTAAGTFTLYAGGAALGIAADASRDFAVTSLVSASGRTWTAVTAADSFVRIAGRTFAFGQRASGFEFQNATVETRGRALQLHVSFALPAAGLIATRHYAIVSGSPSFEAWTTFTPTGTQATLADLNALSLTVPAGTVRWLTGLQGDAANVPSDGAFTLQQKTLASGEALSLGATRRASEETVPWFAIDSGDDEFYAALMWSGAWTLDINRSASGLAVTLGIGPMSTTAQSALDGPHVVFGVTRGGAPGGAAALRSYVLDGIRGGRPLTPLVTYNTWYAYGTAIDEPTLRAEMERAARLGVELFVVDAGWYPGAGAEGPSDFDAGLGSWTADPDRFPNGLRPLRDYAHALGLEFGLWVEPERTNLALVGDPGVPEAWLATSRGDYGSDHAGQICLANAAARQWLLDRLTGLIDDVQPDYLKWDNNMFIDCDRSGHGHGATDGNFAHTRGLYDLLSALRDRYPALLIENVSGGGNRLDVGMLRYTDAAWMDDRTAPSVHVRHNLQGLSAVFPPAYLLSFVTDHDTEPLHDSPDVSLYFRSRMDGALGLCFRTDGFTEGEETSMAREIAIYKALRGTLSVAAGALLTRQASATDPPAWDVLQETAWGDTQVVVSAFQSDDGDRTINVKPSGLIPEVEYIVQSVDAGVLGTALGKDLMTDGIDIVQSPVSAAHILIISARP